MSAVTTRVALPTDAGEAIALVRESITQLCERDHQGDPSTLDKWLSNKTEAEFARWLAYSDGRLIVAVVAPSIAGVGAVHHSGYIRLCYVSPKFTKMGVGRALLDALEAQARAWGLPKIRLGSSLTARLFYERFGYVSAGAPVPAFGVLQSYPYEKQL